MAVYRPPFPSLLSYSLTVNKNPPFFFLSLDAPSFHFLIFDPCVVAILSILPDIFKLYFLPSASHDAAQIEVASCSRLLFGFLKNKKTFSDVPYFVIIGIKHFLFALNRSFYFDKKRDLTITAHGTSPTVRRQYLATGWSLLVFNPYYDWILSEGRACVN